MSDGLGDESECSPMQSPAHDGGVGSIPPEINKGTSIPHPKNTPQSSGPVEYETRQGLTAFGEPKANITYPFTEPSDPQVLPNLDSVPWADGITSGPSFDYDPETQAFTLAEPDPESAPTHVVTHVDHVAKAITIGDLDQVADAHITPDDDASTSETPHKGAPVGLQGVDLTESMPKLPPHCWPLLTSIKHYPQSQHDRMAQELIEKCTGPWKERIALWVKTHPIRSKITPDHVPPIGYFGDTGFVWMTREMRRER